ncbi:MAG: hypothetical protein NDI61_13495 [Bdellovibrionaceae bacterium]|nr:hypothetical protein [Pseudobdellovibrionaceae bacterium]
MRRLLAFWLLLVLGVSVVEAKPKTTAVAKPPPKPKAMAVIKPQPKAKVTVKPVVRSEECDRFYRALYRKPVINIRVVFGYKDTRPGRFVGDRHERLAFVQRILKPCVNGQACGFTRGPQNTDLFIKMLPQPNGKRTRIQLWVAHSAVGSDDIENRRDPFQNWQSRYASDAFFSGLTKADVVLYNGHSRFGGGPDFTPPRLTPGNGIETSYYQDERPGFAHAIDTLEAEVLLTGRAGRLKMLGLFSCASSQHFSDELKKTAKVGVLSSQHLMYHGDALESSLGALSGLLERQCKSDLANSIRSGQPMRAMNIEGAL